MKCINHLILIILTLCVISSSCETIEPLDQKKKRERQQEKAQDKVDNLIQKVEDLKKEREEILALNKQSLLEIKINENKRLAAERAEQIRIKTDALELQSLYDKKLKKIKQQQRFVWDGYIDKTYKSLTTNDGKTYSTAKIIGVDATGIAVQHQSGITRIPFALFGAEIEKENITDFEEETRELEQWLERETEERNYIRNKAKSDAVKQFQ